MALLEFYNSLLDFWGPELLLSVFTTLLGCGVYWLHGGAHLILDVYRRPEVLYAFKIQKSKAHETKAVISWPHDRLCRSPV